MSMATATPVLQVDGLVKHFPVSRGLIRRKVIGMVRAMENMGLDPEGESTLRQWERRLQQIFVGYMQTTPDVHQIRFIALNDRGRELVRVERRNDRLAMYVMNRLDRARHRAEDRAERRELAELRLSAENRLLERTADALAKKLQNES